MPKVSVIMSVYNGEKTISRAINSILAQSYQDFEIVVCDDCSTDNTSLIISELAEMDGRIIQIHNSTNMGLAASLNKCISISQGEYLARMDDDDISHIDRLEKQVSFLDFHPKYSIVGTCRRTFDEQGVWNKFGVEGELSKEDIIRGNIFTHPTVMLRKKDLIESGLYTVSQRTMRGQDYDLWCKMYAHGFSGYVLGDCLLDYYEERNKIKEIKAEYRWNNYKTHKIWRKKMGLPLKYDMYAYKELVAILIPQKLLVMYKKKKRAN